MITNGKLVARNVDPAAYHKTDCERGEHDYRMGQSSLMLFAECPHRWINGYERKETDSTDWGSLMDCLFLTPDQFYKRYAVTPETYPDSKTGEPKKWNWNANFCKDWRESQSPRLPLTTEENLEAHGALARLMASDPVADIIKCSDRQVMLVAEWHDKATGLEIPVKTLIDLEPSLNHPTYGHCLGDFKTSYTANGERWSKIAAEHNYHVQAALSLDIYENATGDGRDSWLNVVQENFAPWEVADPIPMLSQEFIDEGRKAYRAALARYCECLASGEWPSYPTGNLVIKPFQIIDPPAWLAMQQMQRLTSPKPQPAFASEMPS